MIPTLVSSSSSNYHQENLKAQIKAAKNEYTLVEEISLISTLPFTWLLDVFTLSTDNHDERSNNLRKLRSLL